MQHTGCAAAARLTDEVNENPKLAAPSNNREKTATMIDSSTARAVNPRCTARPSRTTDVTRLVAARV